jgi:hypothetical protein
MKYKVQFEIVCVSDLTKTQQKINTWLTTKHLRKYKITPLPDGKLLFEYLIVKQEE